MLRGVTRRWTCQVESSAAPAQARKWRRTRCQAGGAITSCSQRGRVPGCTGPRRLVPARGLAHQAVQLAERHTDELLLARARLALLSGRLEGVTELLDAERPLAYATGRADEPTSLRAGRAVSLLASMPAAIALDPQRSWPSCKKFQAKAHQYKPQSHAVRTGRSAAVVRRIKGRSKPAPNRQGVCGKRPIDAECGSGGERVTGDNPPPLRSVKEYRRPHWVPAWLANRLTACLS
jgi:hypothetical protein